jgi:hypothetical protein
VTGGVHGSNGSRSIEHSYVASATLAMKSIVAVELATSPPLAGSPPWAGMKPGPDTNCVTMPFSLQVKTVGAPTLPSKSVARTRNVCRPTSVSSRPHSNAPCERNIGSSQPHGSYAFVSTRHSNVTSGSFAWNVKMASSDHVAASGVTSRTTTGA